MNELALKELEEIPGVGQKTADYLRKLGLQSVWDLKDKSPEELYVKLCVREGKRVDRCALYVLRCAVYYASNKRHKPELLKWWNWKD